MSILGRTVHVCYAVSKFYYGTRFTRYRHQIWYNRSNSHSVDSQYLPSVICHWPFICGTLVWSVWSCMGASCPSVNETSIYLNGFKVLHLGNLFFLAFNLGCALSSNTMSLLVFRFLGTYGTVGAATFANFLRSWIGGECAYSMWLRCHQRSLFGTRARLSYGTIQHWTYAWRVFPCFTVYDIDWSSLIGPAIGPVIGGFIAESVGVQYVFYVIAAISGVAAILGIPLMRETYVPVIRFRLNAMVLDPEKTSVGHPVLAVHHMDKWVYLWVNLKRPVILLTRSFICFILSLYMAL